MASSNTVQQLKQQLEPLTGLMSRQQKLIFKGKVLEDGHSLTSCKIMPGAKLMLLAAQVGICVMHMFELCCWEPWFSVHPPEPTMLGVAQRIVVIRWSA